MLNIVIKPSLLKYIFSEIRTPPWRPYRSRGPRREQLLTTRDLLPTGVQTGGREEVTEKVIIENISNNPKGIDSRGEMFLFIEI